MSGRIIVIDGLDGSGKATQTRLLGTYITETGGSCSTISFPDYEQPSSSLVRMYLAGEFGSEPGDVNAYAASSFYAVDRYASYKKYWHDDYIAGKTIIADRYTTSNAVHQMSKLPRECWDEYLDWLFDFEYRLLGLPKHDIVIFLDMPLEASQKLMTSRYDGNDNKKDIHERALDYLAACRECAHYAAHRLGWKIINCAENGEPRTIESISLDIRLELEKAHLL